MTKEAYSTEQKIAFIKRLYCPARAVAAATGGNGFEDFMTSLHVAYYRDKADKPRTDVMAALKAPWMKMAEEEFKARVARFKAPTMRWRCRSRNGAGRPAATSLRSAR